ncbi:hypothetical protein [Vibrio cholerae]|uniref:hypothetical protein n=1 Tax=Vibrio cholerae TaxID=666 RepID=UPI0004E3A322|nr:hypothetical protein [Vibrio cholerae]KFE29031.1 hypothetical protein DN30_479 [Vibrio cholerae]
MKFKNISYLEDIDKYQVRLVINGKDFQPTYNTLRKAIINRNKFYLQYAVFPANLFVNKIEAHELVKKLKRIFELINKLLLSGKLIPIG